MSIASFFETLFSSAPTPAQIAAPATAIAAVQSFAASEVSKVMTGLKMNTDIGQTIAACIISIDSENMTGAQKFASVVEDSVPLILKYVTGGGIVAVESDVLSIAQGLVQEIYLDTASTSFGKLAGPLLKLLGL